MRLLPRSRTLTIAAAGVLAVGTITLGGAQLAPPPPSAATVAAAARPTPPAWANDGSAWGWGDSDTATGPASQATPSAQTTAATT